MFKEIDWLRIPCNPCICDYAIFKTLAYLETETSSKACQTCRMIKHIESPGIVEQFILASSRIFNDIQYF